MSRIPVVDTDCCIGCEVCAQLCPEVFRMRDCGDNDAHGHGHGHKAEVYNPGGAPQDRIERAMDNCPSSCIYWA